MPHAYSTNAALETGNLPGTGGIDEIRGMVVMVVRHAAPSVGGVRRGIAAAADVLGLGARRARGYYHNEIRAVPLGELELVREMFAAYLRQRRVHLIDEAAGVDAWLAGQGRAA